MIQNQHKSDMLHTDDWMLPCTLRFHTRRLSKSSKLNTDDSQFQYIHQRSKFLIRTFDMLHTDDWLLPCTQKFRTETKSNSSRQNKFDYSFPYIHHLNKFLIRTFDT